VAASLKALELVSESAELLAGLRANTAYFRAAMIEAGFTLQPGEHPIVPIMFGDASVAAQMAERMLAKGVYVVAFSYPVVPMGKARIRTQISAAHSRHELEFAVKCFAEAKQELGLN
jgi:glycine C-acetyltransferase